MITATFYIVVGMVVKTLVPMPYVDIMIHNAWASVLGYTKKTFSEKVTTTTV